MSSLFLLASTQFITSAASTTSDALSPASLASSAGISSPQGGTYLVPNLVTSGNVPFTFMENFKPLITDDCQETCMPFTNTITQCNATATSDAGLSSCLCASINPVLDCSKCVAEGTLPGATRGSNSSIQAAAAVVVYVDLFNACMQLGLLKPTATETVTILATPQVPPKLFANKSSIQEAHAAAITSNCCRACTRNSSATGVNQVASQTAAGNFSTIASDQTKAISGGGYKIGHCRILPAVIGGVIIFMFLSSFL